jgi:hypothetical protein
MSRTAKTEWHRPDGWHDTQRLARKARPAGRAQVAFVADLALDQDEEEA